MRPRPGFSIYRFASFLLGTLCVWIAISPVESLVHLSLTFHMVQHLLLMAIAPPLILFGEPILLFYRPVMSFLRWNVVKRMCHLLTHPAFCWLCASFALIIWHIPIIFEHAMRWHWLHLLERGSFFGAGLLFWWPVLQPWPSIARWPRGVIPLYLFGATLPCDALSAFLVFCDRVVYSSLHTPRALNLSPIQDQDFAAALMWVTETIILMVPAVVVTLKLLAPRSSRNDAFPVSNVT